MTRKKSNKVNWASFTIPALITLAGGVLVALISCLGSLVLGYWQFVWKPSQIASSTRVEQVEYVGRVLIANENIPIKGAKVTFDGLNSPKVVYTDSEGVYRFVIGVDQLPVPGKVSVSANDFEYYERNFTLCLENLTLGDIRIARTSSPTSPAASSNGPPPISTDWKQSLDISINLPTNQCPSVACPPNFDPENEPTQAALQAGQAKQTGEVDSWPIIGSEYGTRLEITITSLLKDHSWVKLDNSINVIVSANPNLPEHINSLNLAWGCGGEGEIRTFSTIELSAEQYQTYSQQSTNSKFDFLTLQPGEFEVLALPFNCKAPGIYSLSFELPYQINNKSDTLVYEYERPIICPAAYTEWILEEGSFISASRFTWDGQTYQYEP